MSKHDNEHKSPSTLQPIVVVIGLILVAILVVSILKATPVAEGAAPAAAQVADVKENIAPVAAVEVAAADTGAATAKSGEEVVKGGCAMCHATGMMNSPKIGDAAQWEPRIAQGYDTLVKHAVEGIRTMPAKGGNPALSDGEVAAAVVHMANLSGASFEVPKAETATAAEAAPAEAPATN
jgi:cytochrome c5